VNTTIGVIGGGQLGRMLALAGYPLGLRFKFFDSEQDCPAGRVGPITIGHFDNSSSIVSFAESVDIVTFEFENIPAKSMLQASSVASVIPSHETLEISQDRLSEKQLFQKLGLAVPKFAGVNSLSELEAAIDYIGYPSVLKSRHLGYDGKGQAVIKSMDDLVTAWGSVGPDPAILEEFIPFDEEVSAIGVRSKLGEFLTYPICHNTHTSGILRQTWIDPEDAGSALSNAALGALETVMKSQNYVGVLAIELFVRRGQLIANEMAPRVHNSGHWTIDGASTSQFENHVRAIVGLPLGATIAAKPAGMVNIIGALPDVNSLLALPYARIHLYDKEPRAGRKIGHVNVLADTRAELFERLHKVAGIVDNT
jgi:5-(carboxyamino)imidazole ribonucleotide synthase